MKEANVQSILKRIIQIVMVYKTYEININIYSININMYSIFVVI